jgi:DNA-binding transcriptional regulator YhcF (GntR family)
MNRECCLDNLTVFHPPYDHVKARFPKIPEQVAAHLRAELCRGRWTAEMPGRHEVAAELGVSPQTAQAALALLEREGLLASQGSGRPRRIERQKVEASGRPLLRVAILVAEAADRQTDYMVDLKHELIRAGHAAFFTPWLIPDRKFGTPMFQATFPPRPVPVGGLRNLRTMLLRGRLRARRGSWAR